MLNTLPVKDYMTAFVTLIRFEHYESQVAAMECPIHELDGRQIVLRLTKKVKLLISLDSLRFDEFLAERGVRNNFASAHASAGRSYPSQLTQVFRFSRIRSIPKSFFTGMSEKSFPTNKKCKCLKILNQNS